MGYAWLLTGIPDEVRIALEEIGQVRIQARIEDRCCH